jgi:hypothetical protein
MHAECAIPPIKNCHAIKLLYCCNHCFLVSFIAAINHKTAAENWPAHVKTIKGANIAARLTNGGAQPTKGAWDIVELTVESD